MLRMTILLAGMLALIGASAPVGATGAAKPTTSSPAHRVHVIVIDRMQYGPMPSGVRAGDIIEWVNRDILEHSATARDGRFDVDLKPGRSVRSIATAGTVVVFCKFHPDMTATLVVR
ncbi:plasmid stabilization protein [Rhodanobacter ginsengisoli]|uniref:Plasmid stabilization protein n=1 Tax=Rhodanobacter ginsengisoli TaxID=418646 RepID=A0ABW0QVY0_9GAMM